VHGEHPRVRAMFVLYLAVIVAGIAFCTVLGITG